MTSRLVRLPGSHAFSAAPSPSAHTGPLVLLVGLWIASLVLAGCTRADDEGQAARVLPERLFYYEDYVTVDGLTVPTRFRGYSFADREPGAFRNEAWADSISYRRPFDASKLEAPESARTARPPQTES